MSRCNGGNIMKPIGIISTTALFLVLGMAAPANAQQEQQDKPKKQEKQQPQAKPERHAQPQADKQQHQQPQQQQQARGQQDQQRQERQQRDNSAKQQQQQARGQQDQQRQERQQRDNSAKQQQQQARGQQNQQRQERQHNDDRSAQQRSPEHVRQQQVAWQGDRAHSWESEHRTWQQRGGYHGYRVPDYRFRGYYGQDHGFRIYTLPVRYVGGHRRFQYGGYWFGLVDPWP